MVSALLLHHSLVLIGPPLSVATTDLHTTQMAWEVSGCGLWVCVCVYNKKYLVLVRHNPHIWMHNIIFSTGWWLGHPSEKYEFVNWDDERNPILMGK